ncbi:pyrimidine dimer DNA glycosylase/endonuclease V, partial [uncultured Akkermansia sp.]|uniref:pyrimidine dimer DNA glycosylase/endonuclease V n=1 Tax=uncultured Akkermansia sp. TaxID=512294 RepID=UPI0031BB80AA
MRKAFREKSPWPDDYSGGRNIIPFLCFLFLPDAEKINAEFSLMVQTSMRLWSLHPSYLDSIGLIALWREGLLARKVLMGQTKGYVHHPQLLRFRETPHPIQTMDAYLKAVHDESVRRGYSFDLNKISPCENQPPSRILLPDKQLEYEFQHLLNKLKKRSPHQYSRLYQTAFILPHPLFQVIPEDICSWEK